MRASSVTPAMESAMRAAAQQVLPRVRRDCSRHAPARWRHRRGRPDAARREPCRPGVRPARRGDAPRLAMWDPDLSLSRGSKMMPAHMKVGLFIPGYVDQCYPDVGLATVDVLERHGVSVDYPAAQTGCGQPMVNSGCGDAARPFAERLGGSSAVTSTSSSCPGAVRRRCATTTATCSAVRPRSWSKRPGALPGRPTNHAILGRRAPCRARTGSVSAPGRTAPQLSWAARAASR